MPKDTKTAEEEIAAPPQEHKRHLVVFGFLMLAQLVATLDNQIVATALPTIVGELGQPQYFSWLISAHILVQCAVMPIYGKLGDMFGRKYLCVAALAIFAIGSLACAASWSAVSLIAARSFQAVGTGGLLVSVYAVNADLFEPARRARFQSYLSLMLVFGSFSGPVLGGLLTESFGWRSVFFITAPLSLAGILGFLKFLPRRGSRRRPVIDYAGAAALALTVTLLVIWMDSIRIFGSFAAPASLALAAGIVAGGLAWVRIERRAPEPVMPLTLLASRDFALLVVCTMCCGAISIGLINYHAYFLQMAIGLTPSQAGLFFIAITLGVTCGALVSGRLMSAGWHFTRLLRCSLAMSVVMLSIFAHLAAHVPLAGLAAVFVVQGIATGLSMNAPVLGAQVTALPRDMGAATGAISLVRMVGAALGIAVYGAILAAGRAGLHLPGLDETAALTPSALNALPAQLRDMAIAQSVASFAILYQIAACIAAFGFIITLFMRRPAL